MELTETCLGFIWYLIEEWIPNKFQIPPPVVGTITERPALVHSLAVWRQVPPSPCHRTSDVVQAASYDHKLLGSDLHSWSDPENGKVEKSTILLSAVPSGTDSDRYRFSLKL